MFAGRNIVILDLECAKSADDCRFCGQSNEECVRGFPVAENTHVFTKIGWDDKSALGLSIGCYYDYRNSRMHWFDVHTLEATMRGLAEDAPFIVSFNGQGFDGPLMEAVLLAIIPPDVRWGPQGALNGFLPAWSRLWGASYDILAEIWRVDPARKYDRGLNSLNAISQANGFGAKEMDGATAPRLWAQGQYAKVMNYCQGDVIKTRLLFEKIIETGEILRGDGQLISLRNPLDLSELTRLPERKIGE